jgi:RNA polymerase sigma factor (TIGR02999 family)
VTDITGLLARARDGDRQASGQVFSALYGQLRGLAAGQLRGDPLMRATSLVHEAWLKLEGAAALASNDRQHYFAIAARAMRQIVIDHLRARAAQCRGGGAEIAPLETTALQAVAAARDDEVLTLDAALTRLGQLDPALAALVEMRFYAGLELTEIAVLQQRSERSLKRDWRRARAFLQCEMSAG